jgi:hypothetical protein
MNNENATLEIDQQSSKCNQEPEVERSTYIKLNYTYIYQVLVTHAPVGCFIPHTESYLPIHSGCITMSQFRDATLRPCIISHSGFVSGIEGRPDY